MTKPANSQAFYPKPGPTSQVGLSSHTSKTGYDLRKKENEANQKKIVRKYLAHNGRMEPTGRFGTSMPKKQKSYSHGSVKVARAY